MSANLCFVFILHFTYFSSLGPLIHFHYSFHHLNYILRTGNGCIKSLNMIFLRFVCIVMTWLAVLLSILWSDHSSCVPLLEYCGQWQSADLHQENNWISFCLTHTVLVQGPWCPWQWFGCLRSWSVECIFPLNFVHLTTLRNNCDSLAHINHRLVEEIIHLLSWLGCDLSLITSAKGCRAEWHGRKGQQAC